MHTYRPVGEDDVPTTYQVGYYVHDVNWEHRVTQAHWVTVRAFEREVEAARYVNFLNGGRDYFLEEVK